MLDPNSWRLTLVSCGVSPAAQPPSRSALSPAHVPPRAPERSPHAAPAHWDQVHPKARRQCHCWSIKAAQDIVA